MKSYTMSYPGDPPVKVFELSMFEFLVHCPRTPTVISSPEGVTIIPTDDVSCDLCGKVLGSKDKVFGMAYPGRPITRGHCEDCAKEGWLPYCTED